MCKGVLDWLVWSSTYSGGWFFTQTSLMFLASVCFSSRIREFIVVPRNDSIEALKDDVEDELSKLEKNAKASPEYREYMASEYKKVQDNVDRVKAALAWWECWIRRVCLFFSWLFLIFLFLLIIHGKDADLGFWPILFMLHLLLTRWFSAFVYWWKNREFENEKRYFVFFKRKDDIENKKSERKVKRTIEQRFQEITGIVLEDVVKKGLKQCGVDVSALPKTTSQRKPANGSAGSKKKPSAPQPSDGAPDNK